MKDPMKMLKYLRGLIMAMAVQMFVSACVRGYVEHWQYRVDNLYGGSYKKVLYFSDEITVEELIEQPDKTKATEDAIMEFLK